MATKNLKKAKEGTTVRNTLSGGTRTKTVSGNTVNITKTDKAGNIIKNKTRNRIQGWDESEAGGNSGMARKGGAVKKKMAKGGATSFGMLSVKAGIDKNPKATAADRIAGAKKRAKKK